MKQDGPCDLRTGHRRVPDGSREQNHLLLITESPRLNSVEINPRRRRSRIPIDTVLLPPREWPSTITAAQRDYEPPMIYRLSCLGATLFFGFAGITAGSRPAHS